MYQVTCVLIKLIVKRKLSYVYHGQIEFILFLSLYLHSVTLPNPLPLYPLPKVLTIISIDNSDQGVEAVNVLSLSSPILAIQVRT